MPEDFPTFSEIGEQNIRERARREDDDEYPSAQSFPKDYIFTGNRGEVVKQIGNAVCPKMAGALTIDYMRELAAVT